MGSPAGKPFVDGRWIIGLKSGDQDAFAKDPLAHSAVVVAVSQVTGVPGHSITASLFVGDRRRLSRHDFFSAPRGKPTSSSPEEPTLSNARSLAPLKPTVAAVFRVNLFADELPSPADVLKILMTVKPIHVAISIAAALKSVGADNYDVFVTSVSADLPQRDVGETSSAKSLGNFVDNFIDVLKNPFGLGWSFAVGVASGLVLCCCSCCCLLRRCRSTRKNVIAGASTIAASASETCVKEKTKSFSSARLVPNAAKSLADSPFQAAQNLAELQASLDDFQTCPRQRQSQAMDEISDSTLATSASAFWRANMANRMQPGILADPTVFLSVTDERSSRPIDRTCEVDASRLKNARRHGDVINALGRFSGHWLRRGSPDFAAEVRGDLIRYSDGVERRIRLGDDGALILRCDNDLYRGRLLGEELLWDDGDVWSRARSAAYSWRLADIAQSDSGETLGPEGWAAESPLAISPKSKRGRAFERRDEDVGLDFVDDPPPLCGAVTGGGRQSKRVSERCYTC